MMKRKVFTKGLVTGGVIGALGVAWAMSDNKTRRRLAKDSKRAVRKANEMIGNVTDMF
jgi:gas vesicle protein